MGCIRAIAHMALLILIGINWGAVTLSRDTIECCASWQSVVTVTNASGGPYPYCKIFVSPMETRGGIETTLNKYTYITDSAGKATISYTPKKPGERLKISVSCGDNRMESTIPVFGSIDGPTGPDIKLELPPIETWQVAAVVFLLFAAIFMWKWKRVSGAFGKMVPSRKMEQTKQAIEDDELSPKRLILDHERKVAAKLARKHKRKEIRLGHEFMRKL
ncbi:MAG: hypothetical protein V1909_06045 [Candidatus Micrarchaeota archaeon]